MTDELELPDDPQPVNLQTPASADPLSAFRAPEMSDEEWEAERVSILKDVEETNKPREKAPAKKKASKEAALPVFVAMDTFTVNLDQDTGGQYLQVVLSLEVEDAHMGDKIKTYTPKLRNNVIRLLSGKKASELNTPAGKEALAIEIRSLMNEVLEPGAKEGPVKEVLFTNFIIQ